MYEVNMCIYIYIYNHIYICIYVTCKMFQLFLVFVGSLRSLPIGNVNAIGSTQQQLIRHH